MHCKSFVLALTWLVVPLCWAIIIPRTKSGCGLDYTRLNETTECYGLMIEWVEQPNPTVYLGQTFLLQYKISTIRLRRRKFYRRLLYSPHFSNFNTSREIRHFCEVNSCPNDMQQVNAGTCCIHHTGVYVCSPSGYSCGSTQVVAHSWGNILHTFTASVTIYDIGQHVLFVVAKIDNLHLYRYEKINVLTPSECGDGFCHSTESCDECKSDCCPFQLHHLLSVIIGSIVILMLTSTVILIAMWCYYNKHKKLYYDMSWIVDCSEIKNTSYSTKTILKTIVYEGGSLFVLQQVCSSSFEIFRNRSAHDNRRDLQLFTSSGVYRKQDVAIKYVHKTAFNINSIVKKEIYQIRLLDHPNLCKFIGASVEAPKIAILTEYCPKGSLYDVLQNMEIHLSWGFRFSFADDIVTGMAYLHSKGIFHGRLKSSNCLINDRWVLKIADYGLTMLRNNYGASEDPVKLAREEACKVYLAPEIVSAVNPSPTGPADVFSYAVILFEIATRIDLYSSVIGDVSTLCDLTKNYPCPVECSELVQRCCDPVPSKRPTFLIIKKLLQKINPNHESPIDNMILMIQKYTNQLELMVTERTQEIAAEKERSDQLLNNLLPPYVALELKKGNTATARSFDCVSIFFSDIVGFTRLASQSTPMQVVNMLNELYTMFDYILDRFDVYKVETIGDAYMVVSGVPHENGINHASEIACMALDLLSAVHEFTIPHKQSEKLRIRVGIHCGPVVAGIVGTKMPRYCLFGDTVNIASRMEQDGEAMRIHISNTYAQLLLKIGGFHLQRRCWTSKSLEKGSTAKCTWWLNHVTLPKWAFRLHKQSAASMP